ncbi:hypothetical protein GCM10023093_00110 [Nemorincola caseinilytica]|uniref:Uncharacterized protein n=1 Tax=Nemorincola caseinilytica TaxID=2054315 RepID=A0ABP8N383_9BACT
MSKIPEIVAQGVSNDQVRVLSQDTCVFFFSFQDGDADLGNDPAGQYRDVYIKDLRDDKNQFVGYLLPEINEALIDPSKGLKGTAQFYFTIDILNPRIDSPTHDMTDTVSFEMYMMDKAGNASNHIFTPKLYMFNKL